MFWGRRWLRVECGGEGDSLSVLDEDEGEDHLEIGSANALLLLVERNGNATMR
jgi:hypothetical protein